MTGVLIILGGFLGGLFGACVVFLVDVKRHGWRNDR